MNSSFSLKLYKYFLLGRFILLPCVYRRFILFSPVLILEPSSWKVPIVATTQWLQAYLHCLIFLASLVTIEFVYGH